MNKICTSIEQSQKLIELGIYIGTADMLWTYDFMINDINGLNVISEQLKPEENDIPAWSLSALMDLMPPYLFEFERGIDLNIYRNLNGKGWHCSYMPNNIESMKKDKFKQITNGDNAVDAAFEMVVWLKENEMI